MNCVPQEARKEHIHKTGIVGIEESHFQPELRILVYFQNLEQKVVRKESEMTREYVCVMLLRVQVCL